MKAGSRIRGDQLGHGLDGREFVEVTNLPEFLIVSGEHSPVVSLGPSDWCDVVRFLHGQLVGETEARVAYLARAIELQLPAGDQELLRKVPHVFGVGHVFHTPEVHETK